MKRLILFIVLSVLCQGAYAQAYNPLGVPTSRTMYAGALGAKYIQVTPISGAPGAFPAWWVGNAINRERAGTFQYDSTNNRLYIFDGITWQLQAGSSGGGSGISGLTTNTVPKALNSSTIGNSVIIDNGVGVTIGVGVRATGTNSFAVGLNDTAIGNNSVAMGSGSAATTAGSIALGTAAKATGNTSVALGNAGKATGVSSVALSGTGSGQRSFAVHGIASGQNSIAIGLASNAVGNDGISIGQSAYTNSSSNISIGAGATSSGIEGGIAIGLNTVTADENGISMGQNANADGANGVSIGINTFSALSGVAVGAEATANGIYSVALGSAVAGADRSVALGASNITNSFGETVVGLYNASKPGSNGASFVSTDYVFSVGNGTSGSARSNALTVWKNGQLNTNSIVPFGDTLRDLGTATSMRWRNLYAKRGIFNDYDSSLNDNILSASGKITLASGPATGSGTTLEAATGGGLVIRPNNSGVNNTFPSFLTINKGNVSSVMGLFINDFDRVYNMSPALKTYKRVDLNSGNNSTASAIVVDHGINVITGGLSASDYISTGLDIQYNTQVGGVNVDSIHNRGYGLKVSGSNIDNYIKYNLGIGVARPSKYTALEVTGTSNYSSTNPVYQGVKLSTMTQTQRDLMILTSGDEGIEIYNMTTHKKNFWNGSQWQELQSNVAP